jgi:hypothetical protein
VSLTVTPSTAWGQLVMIGAFVIGLVSVPTSARISARFVGRSRTIRDLGPREAAAMTRAQPDRTSLPIDLAQGNRPATHADRRLVPPAGYHGRFRDASLWFGFGLGQGCASIVTSAWPLGRSGEMR